MKYLKTFDNYSYRFNDETIDEGWKDWAVALGVTLSTLVPNYAKAETSDIAGDGIKDRIVNMLDQGSQLTIKKLAKDGYSPAPLTPIKGDRELVDSGIEAYGKTQAAANLQLETKSKDVFNKELGFRVYKEVGNGISVKWIIYK